MGKKVRDQDQPSKLSQNKQFNNLIKLLKPKVYITPSSNFKNLVQQLTGNNIGSSLSSSSSSPPPPPHDQRLQFVHQYQENYSQELSVDSSTEGSIPSSINIISNTLHEPCYDNNSMGSQLQMDISQEYYNYRNIESWLLENDSYTTASYHHHQYEGYGPLINIHEEVSINDYDYDLSGLF
ncbi:hypothetical protein HAX54_022248 [Datura stramonium]|uniref:VQ domain-containing protein n=1 Tax=Datura stramonium TaxID=4076 RepID=A0ABS8UU78_DATST|nr:hypothetical protein [Datura stramonium]